MTPEPGRASSMSGATSERLAEHLAAWGDEIVVIGPADVRKHLAAIGTALVRTYAEE